MDWRLMFTRGDRVRRTGGGDEMLVVDVEVTRKPGHAMAPPGGTSIFCATGRKVEKEIPPQTEYDSWETELVAEILYFRPEDLELVDPTLHKRRRKKMEDAELQRKEMKLQRKVQRYKEAGRSRHCPKCKTKIEWGVTKCPHCEIRLSPIEGLMGKSANEIAMERAREEKLDKLQW